MIRKKGMVFSILFGLAFLAICMLVFIIIFVDMSGVLQIFGKKSACQLDVIAMDALKDAVIPGSQVWQPNCELLRTTVEESDLEDTRGQSMMEKYDDAANWPGDYDYRDFNSDRIMAEHLKYAWSIVGQGSKDYFTQWWGFFRCPEDDPGNPIMNTGGTASHTVPCSEKPGQNWWQDVWIGTLNHHAALTMCMVLGRVKFSEEAQRIIGDDEVTTLNLWMRNNPIDTTTRSNINPDSLMSYFEYLKTDNEGYSGESDFFIKEFKYSTDKPYVIVYAEPHFHTVDEYARKPLEWIGVVGSVETPFNTLLLIPLEETNQYCDYLVGYPG